MNWRRVCLLGEIGEGETRAVALAGDTALLCRVAGEEVFAVEDHCTHPRHGAEFDVRTGAVQRLPAIAPLRTWPARVREGWVEVAEGETP
jgi:3-phenylpropionate/trans-cinnamate dioxygenase ferredoxin subunit